MFKYILFSILSLFSVSAFSAGISQGTEFYDVYCKTDGNDATSFYTLKKLNYYTENEILVITGVNEKEKRVVILGKSCSIIEK